MAKAKKIKGETKIVEKVVKVAETEPDKIVLEMSQDEADVVCFILGLRKINDTLLPSTSDVFSALIKLCHSEYFTTFRLSCDKSTGYKTVPR